ncbi:MAG TPA: YceI family protein, partial [Burkholderiaceae bacterium]|nr:YceI family protein [Burkholderiaceae bacterium]
MTRIARTLGAGIALWLAMGPAHAGPEGPSLVAGQSEISFVSRQMGVPVAGSFRSFDAQVSFDPVNPQKGQFLIGVDVGSVVLPTDDAMKEVLGPAWFDTAHFARATFQSSAIRALERGRYEVAGRLSIKGHAQDLLVPVSLEQSGALTVASGSLVVRRLAFAIGEGEWADTSMVADEVQIRFRLVL